MPTITLKNLPPKLHRALKGRAQAHHRSLNKEVIATLLASTHSTQKIDTAVLQSEAVDARRKFKRIITAKEISSWTRRGRP